MTDADREHRIRVSSWLYGSAIGMVTVATASLVHPTIASLIGILVAVVVGVAAMVVERPLHMGADG